MTAPAPRATARIRPRRRRARRRRGRRPRRREGWRGSGSRRSARGSRPPCRPVRRRPRRCPARRATAEDADHEHHDPGRYVSRQAGTSPRRRGELVAGCRLHKGPPEETLTATSPSSIPDVPRRGWECPPPQPCADVGARDLQSLELRGSASSARAVRDFSSPAWAPLETRRASAIRLASRRGPARARRGRAPRRRRGGPDAGIDLDPRNPASDEPGKMDARGGDSASQLDAGRRSSP